MELINAENMSIQIEEIKEDMDETLRYLDGIRAYYNMVTEPELIDFAIYEMTAAERRHTYLYRKYCELTRQGK